MLNYANLNDVEFESLCRDIMSKKLGIPLRHFAQGRDGGVDLTEDPAQRRIVVQVKHYQKSDVATLVRNLKDELKKVEKLAPEQYYICCSRELSPKQIEDLYQHFHPYMASGNNIVTGKDIDVFLQEKENEGILRKHFKLWIESTGILNEVLNNRIFVDCEVLLSEIERDHRRFVHTGTFDRALACLARNRVLCIIGNPGVGKSMTTKMLALHYAAQGYRVRYTLDVANLSALKSALSQDPQAKEVILLDDCFGQAYFEMKSGQATELLALIQYVRARKEKILILNSRVTIYQEAKQKEDRLAWSEEQEEYQVFVLDMRNLNLTEKAKIFYNHLIFSGIPEDYIQAIKKDRHYAAIVEHPNFSPRIIEYVCSPYRIRDVLPEAYPALILQHLDHPWKMWQDEYEHKLQSVDRILLQTIYSLTNTFARKELVRVCFEHRIAGMPMIDRTISPFRAALDRLNEGFIQETTVRGERMLGMVNPSVNDFLDGYLEARPDVKQEMIRNICNMWQITRLIPHQEIPEYCADLIRTGAIHELIYRVPENKSSFVSYFLISQQIQEASCRKYLWDLLDHPIPLYFHIYLPSRTLINMMLESMTQEFWDFYELDKYFSKPNKIYRLLKIHNFSGVTGCITLLAPFFRNEMWESFTQQGLRCLREKIDSFWDDLLVKSIVKSVIDIDNAMLRAISYEDGGLKLNVDTLEQILHAKVAHKLISALENLGAPFDSLAGYVRSHPIHISDPEKLQREFLESQKVEWETPLRFDEKPAKGYAPQLSVDDIFLR